MFKNNYLAVDEDKGTATGVCTSLYAGCWDDGSRKVGVAGIHPSSVPAGIQVSMVGEAETKDMEIIRLKQYANFAVYNRRGLARLSGILN